MKEMNEAKYIPTLETKYFKEDEHLIWKYGANEADIQTPEGYREVATDKIRIKNGRIVIRKFFHNIVPVTATLYESEETGEIGYFFEGTVAEKEKAKTL